MVAAFSILPTKPVVGALVPAVGRAGATDVVAQEKLLILLHAVSLLKLYAQVQRKREANCSRRHLANGSQVTNSGWEGKDASEGTGASSASGEEEGPTNEGKGCSSASSVSGESRGTTNESEGASSTTGGAAATCSTSPTCIQSCESTQGCLGFSDDVGRALSPHECPQA